MTQQQLGDAAGLDRRSIDRLENGWRRPSTVSTWRIVGALRPRGTLRDRVALDQRLRDAAGPSLRDARTWAREQARAELLAEPGAGPVPTDVDDLEALVVAELAAGSSVGEPARWSAVG